MVGIEQDDPHDDITPQIGNLPKGSTHKETDERASEHDKKKATDTKQDS